MKMQKYSTIDEYIRAFPKATRDILERLRETILKAAPGGEEAIRYGIPTVRLNGKNLVHFAAYENHIAFYPTPSGIEAFKKELKGYLGGKGTVHLSLNEKIPFDLVKRIVEYRVNESSKKPYRQNPT